MGVPEYREGNKSLLYNKDYFTWKPVIRNGVPGRRLGVRLHTPQIAEHNQTLLREPGYDDIAGAKLGAEQIIAEVDETDSDSTGNR